METNYDWLYEKEARTVDLGVAKTTDNFNQAAYDGYAGQTYTFIGNWRSYDESTADPEPTKDAYPTEPTKDAYPTEPTKAAYPTEPVAVPEPSITLADFEAQNKPAVVTDPEITWTDADEALYNKLTSQNDWELVWYGEETITANYNDNSTQWQKWVGKKHLFQGMAGVPDPYQNEQGCFEKCKNTFNNKILVAAYQQYLLDLAAYQSAYDQLSEDWDNYNAFDQEAYDRAHSKWEQDCDDIDDAYDRAHSKWEQDCEDIDDAYDRAHSQWEQDCDDIDNAYDIAHSQWESSLANYPVQIPKYAYFLARESGKKYPKYYREMADEGAGRTGGVWNPYSAIIKPNQGAIDGIEQGVESTTPSGNVKGFDMAFNEDFMGDFDPTEIKEIVAEAEKKGQKVEYFDVVVSINGEIVRQGTSLQGLPSGMYIINGKKYLVK